MDRAKQLEAALRNADAAGDEEAARILAAEIIKMRGAPRELPAVVKGLGNAAAGAIRGAGSIGATLLTPIDLALGNTKSIGNPERRAAMDAALGSLGFDTGSLPFQGGKLFGEISGTLGVGPALAGGARAAGAAPGVVSALSSAGMTTGRVPASMGGKAADLAGRTAAAGAVGFTAGGLVNPEDAAKSGAIGAATPSVVKVAGGAGTLAGKMLRPDQERAALATKAINAGIPLGVSDVSGSQLVKGARSFLDDVPGIGKIGQNRQDAIQQGFNAAVGETFGAKAPKLTPQVMDTAKGNIKAELNRLWGGNALQIDGQMVSDLSRIRSEAFSKLNPDQAAQIDRQLQNLLAKANNAQIDGAFANNWQSELRMVAESEKGLHQKLLADLRKSVISAFNRSLLGADAQALDKARGQYKAFKTVEPLMQKAEAGVAGRNVGDVPAALLPEAVRGSYGSAANSPFADLSQIGSQFVADRVARTGGSARAMVQNSALGTGLAMGAWHNPLIPMTTIPAAAGIEALLSSPALARALAGQSNALANPNLLQFGYRVAPVLSADR